MKDLIFNKFKESVLKIAIKKYPEIRKRKYSLDYYLENFIHILDDVVKWKSLKLINNNALRGIKIFIGKQFIMNLIDDLLMVYLKKHFIY